MATDQSVFRAPAARPTDRPDPNRHTYKVREARRSPACTPNFCVHWVARGADRPSKVDNNGISDRDGVPDFVERVQQVAEHVYSVENGKLGWRDPKSDGHKGGGRGKTDVYLKQLGKSLFGYAAPDTRQATRAHRLPRRLHGYLVLDNNYSSAEFPGTNPNALLAVTFAHEYSHVLQFGYDAYQDPWFAESSAVWMEDQVYGKINDYRRYLHRWSRLYWIPLTANSIREYGSAVWNHWLARRYGPAIVRKAWARAIHVKPPGFSVGAYQRAIKGVGDSDFAHDFARFARDVAEWRTGRAFPEGKGYPDATRQGSLSTDGPTLVRTLKHTTFQLLRIHSPRGRTVAVKLRAPRGVAAAVALVGRLGSERGGRVVSKLRFRRHGGPMTVRLNHPRRFDRLTAVLINADSRAFGFSLRRLDWAYLTDTAPFRVRAEAPR